MGSGSRFVAICARAIQPVTGLFASLQYSSWPHGQLLVAFTYCGCNWRRIGSEFGSCCWLLSCFTHDDFPSFQGCAVRRWRSNPFQQGPAFRASGSDEYRSGGAGTLVPHSARDGLAALQKATASADAEEDVSCGGCGRGAGQRTLLVLAGVPAEAAVHRIKPAGG